MYLSPREVYGLCFYEKFNKLLVLGALLIVKTLTFTMTASFLQRWFQRITFPKPVKTLTRQAANVHQYVSTPEFYHIV